MKLNEKTARQRARFNVVMSARKVADIKSAIRDMEQTLTALAKLIVSEERRTRVINPNHLAYSTAAKAARDRINRLKKSIAEFESQLRIAVMERDALVGSSDPRAVNERILL